MQKCVDFKNLVIVLMYIVLIKNIFYNKQISLYMIKKYILVFFQRICRFSTFWNKIFSLKYEISIKYCFIKFSLNKIF